MKQFRKVNAQWNIKIMIKIKKKNDYILNK